MVLVNIKIEHGSPPLLKKQNTSISSYLIIEFPPQSFGEQAFLEVPPYQIKLTEFEQSGERPDALDRNKDIRYRDPIPNLPSSNIRMAGPSRIALLMPSNIQEVPFTINSILAALRNWSMVEDYSTFLSINVNSLINFIKSNKFSIISKNIVSSLSLNDQDSIIIEQLISNSSKKIAEIVLKDVLIGNKNDLIKLIDITIDDNIKTILEKYPKLDNMENKNIVKIGILLNLGNVLSENSSLNDLNTDLDNNVLNNIPLNNGPHKPSDNVTALEIPYRLMISPIESARWIHSDIQVTQNERTELWHTRLTKSDNDYGPERQNNIMALWSDDFPISDFNVTLDYHNNDPATNLPPKISPFRTSLDPLDRKMLVILMSAFNIHNYLPKPSIAKRLHLSSLGALFDVEGNWDKNQREPIKSLVDLEQWVHLATFGRDQYVRVLYSGFLCPFGFAASLVKVTERKFIPTEGNPNNRIAILKQSFLIVPRESVRNYNRQNHVENNFPFQSVEILTKVTPSLLEPGTENRNGILEKKDYTLGRTVSLGSTIRKIEMRECFWPFIPNEIFRFQLSAVDLNGNRISFSMPLLFVSEPVNNLLEDINNISIPVVLGIYNSDDEEIKKRRRTSVGGSTICYAKRNSDLEQNNCDTQFPTRYIQFRTKNKNQDNGASFYPEFELFNIGIKPIQKLLPNQNSSVDVKYHDHFIEHGFQSENQSEVFLQLIDDSNTKIEFGEDPNKSKSDILGAIATPAMTIQGISRKLGPVANIEKIVNKRFDPVEYLPNAEILGGIKLSEILEEIQDITETAESIKKVPKMISRDLPDKIETTFDYNTLIEKNNSIFISNADQNPNNKTKLDIHTTIVTPIEKPNDAIYKTQATLNNFSLNLFGCLVIGFEDLRFISEKGRKPDVIVNLKKGNEAVKFGGPLEFVNQLRDIIPSNGFSDPPAITITPSGLSAGYSLAIPTVGIGIFSLSGVSLGAKLDLPFNSNPVLVKFNFSERHNPFSLTVSLLGGGGFFALALSTKGIEQIEAALEFGATIALNLGVASGGVEVKAGGYFNWLQPSPFVGSIELSGYVRIHGELSVIGLVSASLTFNLPLSYLKDSQSHNSIIWGEAELIVEIEVLFYSARIPLKCRKEFAGSNGADPKFIDIIPNQEIWDLYCDAFAKEQEI